MVQIPLNMTAAQSIIAQVLQAAESRPQPGTPADNIAQSAAQSTKPKLETAATTAQSKLSQQLFSLDHQSVSKLKMQLFEQVGNALGINLDEFTKFDDFVAEVETAYRRILREAGPLAIKAIERETGLDELGLTLRDVIASMKDPEQNDKVSKALIEKYNLDGQGDDEETSRSSLNWF